MLWESFESRHGFIVEVLDVRAWTERYVDEAEVTYQCMGGHSVIYYIISESVL